MFTIKYFLRFFSRLIRCETFYFRFWNFILYQEVPLCCRLSTMFGRQVVVCHHVGAAIAVIWHFIGV